MFSAVHRCDECQVGFIKKQDLEMHLASVATDGTCGLHFKHHAGHCAGQHPPSEAKHTPEAYDREGFMLLTVAWTQKQTDAWLEKVRELNSSEGFFDEDDRRVSGPAGRTRASIYRAFSFCRLSKNYLSADPGYFRNHSNHCQAALDIYEAGPNVYSDEEPVMISISGDTPHHPGASSSGIVPESDHSGLQSDEARGSYAHDLMEIELPCDNASDENEVPLPAERALALRARDSMMIHTHELAAYFILRDVVLSIPTILADDDFVDAIHSESSATSLIALVDRHGQTFLHHAARVGHLEAAELMLRSDADTNAEDVEGNTALHYACEEGYTDAVDLLFETGCRIDCRNLDGDSPLHLAAANMHRPIIIRLLCWASPGSKQWMNSQQFQHTYARGDLLAIGVRHIHL